MVSEPNIFDTPFKTEQALAQQQAEIHALKEQIDRIDELSKESVYADPIRKI